MKWDLPEEVVGILDLAEKAPLAPREKRGAASVLDRKEIEAILPHRAPFLFVDCVSLLDLQGGIIATRYALSQASAVLAGHFPNHPVWPGTLQVEAIAQAGGLLYLKQAGPPAVQRVTLTRILTARFIRPVLPGTDLEIIARVLDDGLFFTAVGQCLQDELVCSVAAMTSLKGDANK